MTAALVALAAGVGRLEGDGTIAELDLPHRSLTEFLRDPERPADPATVAVRERFDPGSLPPGVEDPRLCPVAGPGASVWAIGLNYRSKQLVTGRELPDEPTLFVRSHGSLSGPGAPIVLPSGSDCVDFEGEIAVVLGATLWEESDPAVALAAVAGVAAANDLTARDVMRRTGNPAVAKNFPGFCPLGAVVMGLDAAGGPDGITVCTRVDGEVRQHDDSSGLILGIGELLAHVSRYTVLRPGDVVLSGTPAGTGDEDQRYLTPGSLVEVTVAGLPPLRNHVVARVADDTDRDAVRDARADAA